MFPRRFTYQDDAPLASVVADKEDLMQEDSPMCIDDICEVKLPCFRTAVLNTIASKHPLHHRINTLLHFYPQFFWRNKRHLIRFDAFSRRHPISPTADTPLYRAAVYLITADIDLYKRTKDCFSLSGVDLTKAQTLNIGPQNYTLLCAASDLYSGTRKVRISDLANRLTVGDESFCLIVSALLICRYGLVVTKESRKKIQYDY